jgi:hypothetical protein
MSEQREGRCLDRPRDAIGAADPESRVSRLSPRERDAERRLEDRDRVALVVARLEELRVLSRPHPLALDEPLSEQTLGRFVEVDDRSPRIDQEHRGREASGEVPRQDEDQVALW